MTQQLFLLLPPLLFYYDPSVKLQAVKWLLTGGGRFAGCRIHQADYFAAHSQAESSNPNSPTPTLLSPPSLTLSGSVQVWVYPQVNLMPGLQRGPKPALQGWKLLFNTPRWGRSFADGSVPEMLSSFGSAHGLVLDRDCSSKKPGQGIFLTWISPFSLSCGF